MENKKTYEELIRLRRSCRTFGEQAVPGEIMQKLDAYLDQSTMEAKKIPARFVRIDAMEAGGKVGSYGMISGVKDYIVGIADKNVLHIEDFGYAFEKIILFATGLGLGTCWLVGGQNKAFEEKLNLSRNEVLAVVSPVGYARQPGFKEGLVRMVVRANKRKPWERLFFREMRGVPLSPEEAGAFALPLEMVRLAPSAANKQPWRVIVDGQNLHFCIERSSGYAGLPIDVSRNDVGIAMCHFELTAQENGLKGRFEEVAGVKTDGLEYVRTWREPQADE